MGHGKEHAGRGGSAGEDAGEHAHHGADVDDDAEGADADLMRQGVEGSRRSGQGIRKAAEAEDLGIGADNKEEAESDGALQHGAGMVLSGLRASSPSAVALSNPTKLKRASTMPRRIPETLAPRRRN